jgi:hypothetical protein
VSFINRLSHAVDLIENRSQQGRPFKVVQIRRGYDEDPDAELDPDLFPVTVTAESLARALSPLAAIPQPMGAHAVPVR